jgi:hypothetical protein
MGIDHEHSKFEHLMAVDRWAQNSFVEIKIQILFNA